jgi:hypothetical protein
LHGGVAFLQGFFEKTGVKTWHLAGEFVVKCAVFVVIKCTFFAG